MNYDSNQELIIKGDVVEIEEIPIYKLLDKVNMVWEMYINK